MKICLINNLFPPLAKGGAEKVVENTALGLLKRGHQVLVITLGGHKGVETRPPSLTGRARGGQALQGRASRRGASLESSALQEFAAPNKAIKIYTIKPRNLFSYLDIDKKPVWLRLIWWLFNIFNLSANRQIKKILQQEKPDVAHSHNLTGIGFLVPRLVKKMHIKHIHTLHDIQLVYPSGQLIYGQENSLINKFFLRKWYEKLTRGLFNSPNVVISPSHWLMEFYEKRGFFEKSEKVVLGNPIDKITDYQLPITNYKNKTTFLYVGRVEAYKGILFLVKTISQLPITNYRLCVVGDGRDLPYAKKMARNNKNIIFYGALDKNELERIYQQSDILIMPTLTYENQPTVILEAFGFGLPVVASRFGGIPELVTKDSSTSSGQVGWLFEPGNANELKQILSRLAEDYNKDKIKEMREVCLQRAKRLRLERHVEELEKIYKEFT